MPVMELRDIVEYNPTVQLAKGLEYDFIAMEDISPGRRYVIPRAKRVFRGGGAKFRSGDILFARITPCLENGKIAQFIKKDNALGFGSTEFFVFRNKDNISEQSFIYYLLCSDIIRRPAEKSMSGATGRQRASIDSILSISVNVPPLPTQRKIAAILSAYDDLIENNTRRIQILEEMAQAIYREWFVNFRFPGHENVKMVESELGLIPEGWKVEKLGHVAHVNAQSLKPKNAPSVINYVDIASVSPGSIDEIQTIPFASAPGRARRLVKHGDIIWSTVRPNRKSFALIQNPLPDMVVSTGFAVVSAKSVPYSYLYEALTTDTFVGYLVNHAKGSAYPAVSKDDFDRAPLLVPPTSLLKMFHGIVSDMLLLIHCLRERNYNLRRTRDLLLPKLVSGEVDVSEMDIDFGGEEA